jgi:hypothetical protein
VFAPAPGMPPPGAGLAGFDAYAGQVRAQLHTFRGIILGLRLHKLFCCSSQFAPTIRRRWTCAMYTTANIVYHMCGNSFARCPSFSSWASALCSVSCSLLRLRFETVLMI